MVPARRHCPGPGESNTITEITEYEGKSHLMPSEQGWEEIADYALDWALQHAGKR